MKWLIAIALCLATAAPVAAQEVQEPRERARSLFDQGMEALEGLRFSEARERFEASLTAYPNGSTAFNLGLAHRGLGQSRAAIAVWSGLLDGRYGELAEAQLEEVNRLIAEERRRLARLEVSTTVDAEVTVRIDGEDVDSISPLSRQIYVLDPGRHILVARAVEHEVTERTVELSAGTREALSLALAPMPATEGGSVLEEAWFWTVLGVLVVGAAVGATLGAVLSYGEPEQSAPFGVVRTP